MLFVAGATALTGRGLSSNVRFQEEIVAEPTEIVKTALSFAAEFSQLSWWAAAIVLVSIAWKLFLSGLVDRWLSHKLEVRTAELAAALDVQKEAALRKMEFESIRINKAMPLIEKMNVLANAHAMVFQSYLGSIRNKLGAPKDWEKERLRIDTEFIEAMSVASIYLPREFRHHLFLMRRIFSCSLQDPIELYRSLRSAGPIHTQVDEMNDRYNDAINCFRDMCGKYIGMYGNDMSYSGILRQYKFDESGQPIMEGSESRSAWKIVLLWEYFGSSARLEALDELASYYSSIKPN